MRSYSSNMDPPFSIKNRDSHLARIFEVVLGIWVFASPLLFLETEEQLYSNVIAGIVIVAASLVAVFFVPKTRYVTGLAGAWLVVSAFVLPSASDGPVWNAVIMGILAMGLSIVPNYGSPAVLDRMHHLGGHHHHRHSDATA